MLLGNDSMAKRFSQSSGAKSQSSVAKFQRDSVLRASLCDPRFDEYINDASRFEPKTVQYLELWQLESGETIERNGYLEPHEVERWVKEDAPNRKRMPGCKGGSRFIIGPWQDQTPSLPFSRDAFETVLDHCSIPPTFLTSCFKIHYCVSTARTKLESDGIMSWVVRAYTSAAAVSYNSQTNTTVGLLLARVPEMYEIVHRLRNSKAHACHPMMAPSIIAAFCIDEFSTIDIQSLAGDVLNLERVTGLRDRNQSDADFHNETEKALTKAINVTARLCNSSYFCSLYGANLVEPICRAIDAVSGLVPTISEPSSQLRMKSSSIELLDHMEYLLQSRSSAASHIETLQKRMEFLSSALHTLYVQRDSKQNIEMAHNYKNIARLNLEMAKDSKSLVSTTKHDSPSMKAAALLLALFLPATFIAVIFCMPIVNVQTARYWIYLAAAIPLTVLVVGCWAFFLASSSRKSTKDQEDFYLEIEKMA
ncbi:hypothetical protein HDK90DRAFT_116739 [Phyllosticta capitalensis]|uniref:Uncharacterized protein n=2 Tax=Phyllosticta capitalensis TaxID=121624 RepID=A0ABR1YAK5_9PEZI